MGLSLPMRNDVWMDGVSVAGQDLRLQQAGSFLTGASPSGTTGIAARPGVRYGTGQPLQVNASSGMNLTVNAGIAWVQGSAAANAGVYTGCLDTSGTITVAGADPTNPRIDNVIVQVIDLGTSGSTTAVTLQTGTPAPSPVPPTLPANSLLLAQIAVGAGVSSITAANITDMRPYTVTTGGILPMANTTSGITGPAGLYAHDLSTGRLRVSDGSGNARQPKVGAIAASSWSGGSYNVSNGDSNFAASAISVTVDGATEIQVIGHFNATWQNPVTVGAYFALTYWMDGSVPSSAQYSYVKFDSNTPSVAGSGTTFIDFITPAAGTHTFQLITHNPSNNSGITVVGPYFRIAPSLQQ